MGYFRTAEDRRRQGNRQYGSFHNSLSMGDTVEKIDRPGKLYRVIDIDGDRIKVTEGMWSLTKHYRKASGTPEPRYKESIFKPIRGPQ